MAISVADNFSYKGSKPLDARIQYSTVANMKNATTSDLYDGCLAYVTEIKKNYQYDSTNSVDPTTGKWRELQTGGGGGEGGHIIEDNGTEMTQRDTLNFVDFDLEDDDTNEKTVVQSHELTQEEFEEIFSSGLPGAITGFDLSNTTCEANIHSTDERVIGQWIDGKPIYQKDVQVTFPSGIVDGTTKYNIVAHNIPIDSVISCTGVGVNGQDVWGVDNNIYVRSVSLDKTNITASSNRSTMSGVSMYTTLRYTKTTDSAVASGEKIVGQWIDGKPIFEKVVTFATEKQTTAGTVLTIASSETGLANIDTTIYIQALNYASGVVGQVIPARYNLTPAGELKVNTYENAYIKYLVLRYTKS